MWTNLIIALRAKSVGEAIDVKYTCKNTVDGVDCNTVFPASMDIAKIKVTDKGLEPKIRINNTIVIKMRYPSYAVYKSINENDILLNKKLELIAGSIEYIQDKDKIITTKDVTRDEMIKFLEGG